MILCWSAKGGSGTTVVAAALALLIARTRPCVLADLAGDLPAALGLPEPAGPGLHDWLASPTADVAALCRLAQPVTDGIELLPCRALSTRAVSTAQPGPPNWAALAEALTALDAEVVIDAGAGPPPPSLLAAADRTLLVTRPCYIALRRAVADGITPTAVVVVCEPGRSLGVRDIEQAVGAPVVAEVPFDPAIARAVDAGLLAARVPRTLLHSLRGAA